MKKINTLLKTTKNAAAAVCIAGILVVLGAASGCSSNTSDKSEDYITEDKAKAIAVEHAGFSASDVEFSKVKLDYEDGQRVYEIEFYKDGREYEYEINALSGKIVKNEID